MGGWGIGSGVRSAEGFEFFEGAWPVGSEQAREASVGEHLACGLAAGAVVGFVVGVADALDLLTAARAGVAVAAVRGHVFAECGDFFGEGVGFEAVDPELEGFARGGEEARPLFIG